MNPHQATSTRTLSISEIHSTLLSDEHQEAPEVLEALKGLGALEILSEDQTPQEKYPLLILSPYNLQET